MRQVTVCMISKLLESYLLIILGIRNENKPLNMKILKIELLSPFLRVTSPNNRFNTRFSGHICTTAHVEVAIRCFVALEHESKDFDRLCVEQLNDA